jgi:hypothetical protein
MADSAAAATTVPTTEPTF